MNFKNKNLTDKLLTQNLISPKISDSKLTEIEKYAQLGQLSSGLIHDLISPITSLNLQIELLNEKNINNPEFIDSIKTAIKNINRYAELIKSYIGGKEEKSLIILDEEIQKAIELISYKAIKNNIQIQFIRNKKMFISINPVLIYQIVISLVANAIEAFRDFDDIRKVIIKLKETKHYFILSITDFGQGIIDKKIIFERFYTTKINTGGTGIGLSSVKHIVEEKLDGKIIIKSEPNEGTEFIIKIKKNII